MLLIPITGKISWRNPPIVTIGLIVINCLVFFMFQFNEGRRYLEAEQYYFDSGLAQIELDRYWQYLDAQENAEGPAATDAVEDASLIDYWRARMDADTVFMTQLKNDRIITPDDPDYDLWKELRGTYTAMLEATMAMRFGFRPSNPRLATILTHMFLHGGFGHLLSNMVFLWLVGCLLEMGSGRIYFGAVYLLSGVCAVGLFWAMYMHSSTPLVGASGAISGLMGAFTVLYGRRKVKIFYSLGVYFNYVQVSAIVLLPIWIANELFQLFFGGVSHVAYVAHIGGLISGALLGAANQRYWRVVKEDVLEPEPEDTVSPLIEDALEHVGRLEMDAGRRLLEEALAIDPHHLVAMTHLFNLCKTAPQSPGFDRITGHLLNRLIQDKANPASIIDVYEQYTQRAKPPRLPAALHFKLSTIYAQHAHPEKAERILAVFLKQKPDYPGLPVGLLKLAEGYRDKQRFPKWQQCLKRLCTQYPKSPEARLARDLLAKPSDRHEDR
jgi:membrane associated rhomboid family serine protease